MKDYQKEYERWLNKAVLLKEELKNIDDIEDSFYRDLEFGTGGLRGILGPGTNRMNIYTVAKASQGLANYVLNNYPENKKIAIAYDSRINSDLFSKIAAGVFAKNNIETYIYKELMPTPTLSYAVRYYGCAAGIIITASHNPAKYNGYKVYGSDGCQITNKAADLILSEINKLDIFDDVKLGDFNNPLIHIIGDDCFDSFIREIKNQSVLFGDEIKKDLAIVYTPLNGTGLKPVLRILNESGYTNVTVVKEQEKPDGTFKTCPYPNPEIKEALKLGIEYAYKVNADILLAIDPDADRVGIAVKDNNEMRLLTGNEVGMLLLDYICSQRIKHHKMPNNPIMVKTIVTIDMAQRIASHYNVKTINVLTGFKYIGEQIGIHEDQFIFGFEESYGYLSGSYVRDKDAIDGVYLIVEMFAYYKTRGISLIDKLNELYKEYGYCLNTLHSYEFNGLSGFNKMNEIMNIIKGLSSKIANKKIIEVLDYNKNIDGLPKSNVIKFILEDNCSIVIRPSGTEPKLKTYISVSASNKNEAANLEKEIVKELEKHLN